MADTSNSDIEAKPVGAAGLSLLGGMISELELSAALAGDSGVDFAAQAMANILAADDLDDIFAAQESASIPGQDYADRPFYVKADGITWMRSAPTYVEQGAFPFYVLMKVRGVLDGEEVTLNCGGKTLISVVYKLQKNGYLENEMALYIRKNAAATSDFSYLTLHPYQAGRASR